ncbi:MAG: DUF2752 domain-containing protein [Acidimicrobiia bacterium]
MFRPVCAIGTVSAGPPGRVPAAAATAVPAAPPPAAPGPGRGRTVVDLGPLRAAGAAMVGAAVVLPLLPGPVGVACPLRSLTGIACPLCGATRSVVAAVHGRWAEALALNPAGVAAVVAAAVLVVVRRPASLAVPSWAPPAALAVLWAYQLWRAPAL